MYPEKELKEMRDAIKYTQYITAVSYTDQYPDIIEFKKPLENCIQAGSGKGVLSKYGKPLQSEGFGKCFALLIRDKKNLESALFHIDDLYLSGRNGQQEIIIREFMQDYLSGLNLDVAEKEKLKSTAVEAAKYELPENARRREFQNKMCELNVKDRIQGQFVFGDISRDWVKDTGVKNLLNCLGIKIAEDIRVNTGDIHWSIVYKPQESTILVDASKNKKVLSYSF